jgi:hypothetical protein
VYVWGLARRDARSMLLNAGKVMVVKEREKEKARVRRKVKEKASESRRRKEIPFLSLFSSVMTLR